MKIDTLLWGIPRGSRDRSLCWKINAPRSWKSRAIVLTLYSTTPSKCTIVSNHWTKDSVVRISIESMIFILEKFREMVTRIGIIVGFIVSWYKSIATIEDISFEGTIRDSKCTRKDRINNETFDYFHRSFVRTIFSNYVSSEGTIARRLLSLTKQVSRKIIIVNKFIGSMKSGSSASPELE